MSENMLHLDELALRSAMGDLVLESSRDELIEALGEQEFAVLAQRGRSVVERALRTAGLSPARLADEAKQLHEGLGVLLQFLRRQKGLSDHDVAEQADIDEGELRKIELVPGYQPNPRTISNLERFFRLPRRSIAMLTGAVRVEQPGFAEEVVQFAAKSTAIGKLTKEERQHLNRFVKILEHYTDRDDEER